MATERAGQRIEPVIVVAVAVLYVALAVSNGGYSRELTAGATVAIWWAVLIAIALGGRPRSRVPAPALGAGICLAALAAWTAISIGWASDNGSAFFEVVRVLGYLGLFVLVVIASPRASARAWLGGLALGLVIVAGLALLSRFEPSFGGDKELGTFLPAAAGRLSYPIGYWNGLAAVMAIAVVLLVWLGGHARAAWVRAASVAADPVADPGHLSGLLARRGDRGRRRARRPAGARPGAGADGRGPCSGRGRRGLLDPAREPPARARRRARELGRRGPGRSDAGGLDRGRVGGRAPAAAARSLDRKDRGSRPGDAGGRRGGRGRGDRRDLGSPGPRSAGRSSSGSHRWRPRAPMSRLT